MSKVDQVRVELILSLFSQLEGLGDHIIDELVKEIRGLVSKGFSAVSGKIAILFARAPVLRDAVKHADTVLKEALHAFKKTLTPEQLIAFNKLHIDQQLLDAEAYLSDHNPDCPECKKMFEYYTEGLSPEKVQEFNNLPSNEKFKIACKSAKEKLCKIKKLLNWIGYLLIALNVLMFSLAARELWKGNREIGEFNDKMDLIEAEHRRAIEKNPEEGMRAQIFENTRLRLEILFLRVQAKANGLTRQGAATVALGVFSVFFAGGFWVYLHVGTRVVLVILGSCNIVIGGFVWFKANDFTVLQEIVERGRELYNNE